MKVSELIKLLQNEQARIGDVEIHEKEDDGHSTYAVPFSPVKLVKKKIWQGHSQPPLWYFGGKYD